MKIFIWEDNGISTGYHDDGTLVVLAETVEEARTLAIDSATKFARRRGNAKWDTASEFWIDGYNHEAKWRNPAIERKPDRTIELDTPRVVAFNGGGYD